MMPRLCLLTSFVLNDKCLQLSLAVPIVSWTIHQILPSEKEENGKKIVENQGKDEEYQEESGITLSFS